MSILTIDDLKKHARIDSECEDDVLQLYIDSAEATTMNYLNRTLDDLVEEYDGVPAPVRQAMLMLAAHGYNQREPVSPTNLYTVPYTYDALVKPYMIL